MACDKSDRLMMKYMDQTITEKEARLLHKHLSLCGECKENFQLYDEILSGFAAMSLETAAEGFEAAVMEKVRNCGVRYEKGSAADSVITFLIGTVSVVFGLCFMLVVHREQIMTYLKESAALGPYARAISPMVNVVTAYTDRFLSVLSDFASGVGGLVSDYKYVVLAAALTLLATQYMLHKKDKVEV